MASAEAVLPRIKAAGPELQQRIAAQAGVLACAFDRFCLDEDYPMRMVHFSSLFRFIGEGEYSLQRFPLAIDLFFQVMAMKGVYVLETRVCFLSASHTPDDVATVLETAKECLASLRRAGFFARMEPSRGHRASAIPVTDPAPVGGAY